MRKCHRTAFQGNTQGTGVKQKLLLCAAGAISLLSASTAMAQTACETYTIQPGDTLRAINIRAYGNDGFRALFEANRGVIGPDANLIEVGSVLEIPCAPGGEAATAERAPAGDAQPVQPIETIAIVVPPQPQADGPVATAEPQVPASVDVSFITYNGNAPYSGSDLPRGGLATELLETAYRVATDGAVVDVTVVRDLSSFLRAMGSEAYDVGFPSIRPDCNVIETLAVEMIELCAKYAFSQPFHEIQMTAWTLTGSPITGATDVSTLSGSRICRPAGLFTFDLDADRLPGRGGALTAPASATACFEALAAGETDVVSLPRNEAQAAVLASGLTGRIAAVPALERGVTLHAVANQSNSVGVAAISRLNRGLEAMREDGSWFQIVARQLSGG